MLWTSRRGGSTSMFSPSTNGPSLRGWLVAYREPRDQSVSIRTPKLYLLLISVSVIASQSRSGVVLM